MISDIRASIALVTTFHEVKPTEMKQVSIDVDSGSWLAAATKFPELPPFQLGDEDYASSVDFP
jgi:hypothetical protein